MTNVTPEKLKELYQKLPQDVQDAYFGIGTAEILQDIAKKNKLTTERLGIMADETGLLMLGITHPNEFITNLADRMEIEKELARKIAHEINEKVFSKIRESLRKIHKSKTETEAIAEKKPEPTQQQTIPQVIKPLKTFAEEKQTDEAKDIFEQRNKTFRSPIDPYREPTE